MELSQAQKDALLTGLHLLAKDGPSNTSVGICWNLEQLAPGQHAYDLVSHYSVGWPGLTGEVWVDGSGTERCTYPIKRAASVRLWAGSQLKQRMSLIKYLSASLQA